ncbi:phospholipid-translocating P-type ATPase [Aureobasidium pullulans]|uniref:Phospholipid-transporting ATPase n=1 Tax=Aureobasidium pullulans TaxID=5580 RepID=A0A4S9BG69_AURPU|nr:phospholipid-translocating P-type ATPase [Aureobasidium pullulans]
MEAMVGHDDHSDAELGGVRRRHSAHYDEDDMHPIPGRHDTLSSERPQSSPSTSGTDIPLHSLRNSSENSSRVRFSLQEQRPQSQSRGKKRKSDEDTRPDLTVDVNAAAAHSVLGENTLPSPSSMVSLSSNTRPKASPLSPQTRARGYSLRSSLFQRNMHDRSANSPSSPSIIEMAPIAQSSQHGTPHTPTTPRLSKKSMDTVVEVAPLHDDGLDLEEQDPKRAAFNQPKGVQGIGALPHYHSWIQEHTTQNQAWRSFKEGYHKARKFVLRIQDIPPTKDGRHIDLDASRKTTLLDERTNKAYITNYIRSSRYTAWNFVPRQLFAQFSKLANFYFLCVSILQMIPGLSTTGTYTTIIPLLFFVALSMGKEGYDDLRRYRLDKVENNREASVLHAYRPITSSEAPAEEGIARTEGPIHWAKTKWQNLQVGDIVRLERDEPVPADMVLLSSKGTNGIAYIETMALDGETNLKSKQATANLAKQCDAPEKIATCKAHFVVEDPNIDLYNFEGKVTLDGQTAPLSNNEIMYRGSVLRNTPEAYGMVIYSGEECKIRMNSNKNPRIKAPALQAIVNKVVIVIVIFVILLAIFNTVAYQVWRKGTEDDSWYLNNARVAFFPVLTSFIIMFNTMIPLSLYVSMEIVKVWQMVLLNDIDMYDETTNTPFEARTSTINEELGQISYIFSDKTGTLTDNMMKFRKLSVAGTAWLHDVDLQDKQDGPEMLVHKKRSRKSKGKKPMRKSTASVITSTVKLDGADDHLEFGVPGRKSTSQWTSSARPGKAQPELSTKTMIRYLQRKPFTLFAKKARMLLLSMALCHTCLPETQEDGEIDFQASSPDELALVRAAQELGYLAMNRESAILTIKTFPNGMTQEPVLEQYEILDVIEFSSKRKRMSVTVRFPDGRVCVICKGADTIVMQRLKLASLANQKMVEIEKRTSMRKSLEAQEAIRRQSEQHERSSVTRPSFSRPSFSMSIGRPSVGALPRTSVGTARLQPIRDELNIWLRERESEVDVSHSEDPSVHYSPRPSTQMHSRQSLAPSEARSSLQYDDFDQDELVEESLVTDEATVLERCFQHINDFATEGLRTLLYGHRFLDEQEYLGWKKFRFLVKLLLVHGRWNYIRICKYTVGTFWKEFLFYLTQALYQRWAGYTGTSLYESWSLSMFNTLFTSLPVIFLGIFEKDLLPQTLIAVPELYTKGQRNGGFNFKIFLAWIFMASSEAIMVYFIMFGLYAQATFTKDQGLYAIGSLTFTACIILISMKLQVIEIHNKSIMAVIACFLSIGGWFLWMIILASIYADNVTYNVKDSFFVRFGDNMSWWLTLILIVVATMWFEFGVKSFKSAYFATDVDLFQLYERDLDIRKRFEEASATELQAGWHHGTKKSSFEQQREHEAQAIRELEIQDLLDRPRVMEEGGAKAGVTMEEQMVFVDDGPNRPSTDIQEMLSRRFGSVQQGGIDADKK